MNTVYQVQSRSKVDLNGNYDWLDDHLPFDSREEADNYIKTQPRCFEYRITSWEEPETDSEWLDFNDAWDANGDLL